jgi:hypothetical protein
MKSVIIIAGLLLSLNSFGADVLVVSGASSVKSTHTKVVKHKKVAEVKTVSATPTTK